MARAGEAPEVVLEATYGWYWAADTVAELGARVHLAHPLVKAFSYRRVKMTGATRRIWRICCAGGQQLLARVELPPACRARISSALRVLECLDFEVEVFTNLITGRGRGHRGYTAIQVIPGVGAILGAVFVAEIGDVHRVHRAAQLASWAG
jgi:transposase